MTLNGVMALILRYFTEIGSFRGVVRKSGWRFRRKKVHVRYFISWWVSRCFSPLLLHCGMFRFWRRQSVVFCLCMKYLGNRWTDLRLARTSLKVKVKGQRSRSPESKTAFFSALLAACARFMFGKTFLASSCFSSFFLLLVQCARLSWLPVSLL